MTLNIKEYVSAIFQPAVTVLVSEADYIFYSKSIKALLQTPAAAAPSLFHESAF